MTTNLHDKMLAAIDAYFSASDSTEAEVAENLLLDVRDEINKQKYVPETNFGNMAEPRIGCVNHDCDKCKAVQEPVAKKTGIGLVTANGWDSLPVGTLLYTAPQPVPVKTYHDGKPWPVAPKPWVGLTDEEIDLFINGRGDEDDDNYVEPTGDGFGLTDADLMTLVRRAEAKLREKNGGAA
jgi:hypothetical protein